MKITETRLMEGDGERVLARATIIIDEMMAIHGLAVMKGHRGGLHLAFPTHKHSDGTKKDTAHPLNRETREYIEGEVFAAYNAGKVARREA